MKKKKTLPAKKALSHTHKKTKRYNKGALGAGFAYAMLATLVILAAGSVMIGNISPNTKSPQTGQSVIISLQQPEPSKNNLQLYTFPGATETPTPSPTNP